MMSSLVLIAHFNLYLSSLHSYEKLVDTWARYPRMTMPEGQSCTRKYLKRRRRAKDSTTLLGVVVSVCRPLPTRTQQLPTLLAQQCWELLRPFAGSLRGKSANFSRLHCLKIPRRDLSTKKTKPSIEIWPESLGVMLEFFIYQAWAIHALIYTRSLDASSPLTTLLYWNSLLSQNMKLGVYLRTLLGLVTFLAFLLLTANFFSFSTVNRYSLKEKRLCNR